jgi:hypothetical protein
LVQEGDVHYRDKEERDQTLIENGHVASPSPFFFVEPDAP